MEWGAFSFEWRQPGRNFQAMLLEIEALKLASEHTLLPRQVRTELDKLHRVRAVHGTTAIEGNALSTAAVAEQLELLSAPEPPFRARPTREQRQVRNAGLAQDWVRLRFTSDQPPLRLEDILHLHELVTTDSDERDNTPGRWREFQVTVGSPELGGVHRGAPPERLTALMREFVDFLHARRTQAEHPAVRALLAHFFLVTIHPFGDGNGRVSRLVEAAILHEGGYNIHGFYGLSNYFYRHESEYKRLLQDSRAEQPFDVGAFIEFGLRGFVAELKGINLFIQNKLNRLTYRNLVHRAGGLRVGKTRRLLNRREQALLEYLLDLSEPQDPFTATRVLPLAELLRDAFIREKYHEVSRRTLLRELGRLEEVGFLHYEDAAGAATVELNFHVITRY
jgi:Fic family protein